jgi:hypothetical protein
LGDVKETFPSGPQQKPSGQRNVSSSPEGVLYVSFGTDTPRRRRRTRRRGTLPVGERVVADEESPVGSHGGVARAGVESGVGLGGDVGAAVGGSS